ncbi:membrane dipeptidase [Rhizobiales bacterium]|uniref:dipeptidase n=1 Tax=Hongsoonwoonella zoysiae TaxID=2821844 RepID=UPI00155FACDE|nr:dipeptidase [Hongsoonwoonella zoysiae]NRG16310.1 membrane dipeptidase [Hongsoonwoonella zoysiae]
MQPAPVPVFDGHNDTLLKLELQQGTAKNRSFFEEAAFDHIDLPRAKKGGFAGGLFAMFVPSRIARNGEAAFNPADPANFAEISQEFAHKFTSRLFGQAERIAEKAPDLVSICRSSAEIREAMGTGRLAMILHIEGAEAIGKDLAELETFHGRGLRSLGPVWSRKNIFGDGVPMAFPASPDTGPGLTDAGKELVKECNRLKIQIDLSHITEKGFWDVAKLSDAPLVASHSNAHAVSPSPRNLTDRQLDAIAETGGLVGLNFHVGFTREDGAMRADTPLETLVRHMDHLIGRLGEDGVALGSDFDGCLVPAAIKDVAGLPKLVEAFRKAGYGEELIEKLCWKNWISVLQRAGI